MTELDLSLLEPYATVTFDDYKNFQSVPGQKDQVELYFEELGNQAAVSGNTCTEPCTYDWPFDHQSGERSCCTRHPHDQGAFHSPLDPLTKREKFDLPSEHPINQLCVDWMCANVSADNS